MTYECSALSTHVIGVDPGKSNPTGIAVVEVHRIEHVADEGDATAAVCEAFRLGRTYRRSDGVEVPTGALTRVGAVLKTEQRLTIGHLERLRGVSYPDVVRHVYGLLQEPRLRATPTMLVCDATGVGAATVDLFRELLPRRRVTPVIIHGGQTVTFPGGGFVGVPKADLVGQLDVLFGTGRLTISKALPQQIRDAFERELASFHSAWTPSGSMTYEAATAADGTHGDLVVAAALAAWQANFESRKPDRNPANWKPFG